MDHPPDRGNGDPEAHQGNNATKQHSNTVPVHPGDGNHGDPDIGNGIDQGNGHHHWKADQEDEEACRTLCRLTGEPFQPRS